MNVPFEKDSEVKVLNSEDVYSIMKQVLLRENKIEVEQEHVWVLSLNTQFVVLNIELIGLGSLTRSVVEPIQVYRMAVHKGATSIIMVHNHPSGVLIPSDSDLDTTDKMIQAGRIIDIDLVDHLIISTSNFISFEEEGVMDELRLSSKYIPPYEVQEVLKAEAARQGMKKGRIKGLAEGVKEGKNIGYQNGRQKEREVIARKMRDRGIDVLTIHEATGLSLSEIEKL